MLGRARFVGVGFLFTASLLGCGSSLTGGEPTGTSSAATTICGSTTVTGIDVYHGDNNGNAIDWMTVAGGGASFAFAKATESTNFDDPMFATNWAGMKAAGLKRGAYHFFDPTADPTAQATFFLQAVGTVSPGDMLVLDFETSGGESDATLSSQAQTFLSAVQTATGTTPLLYASSEFLSDWGGLGVYPLWVANYAVTCPDVPSAWTTYTFWQNSGSGMVTGINAPVDTDSFNGTLAQLQAFGGSATDGGTVAMDASVPTEAGSTTTADSGMPPELDSGTPTQDQDSAAPPVVDGGAPVSVDSGAPETLDSGRAVQDAGRVGTAEPTAPHNAGCSCRQAGATDSPGAALAVLATLAGLATRRRRTRLPGGRPPV